MAFQSCSLQRWKPTPGQGDQKDRMSNTVADKNLAAEHVAGRNRKTVPAADSAVLPSEPVVALCLDGRVLEATLVSFSGRKDRAEIAWPGASASETLRFEELRWLKLTRPVDAATNAAAF